MQRAVDEEGDTTAPAMLARLVLSESLPQDVRQQLLFWELRKKERRLREKDLEVVREEIVSVSARYLGGLARARLLGFRVIEEALLAFLDTICIVRAVDSSQ